MGRADDAWRLVRAGPKSIAEAIRAYRLVQRLMPNAEELARMLPPSSEERVQ